MLRLILLMVLIVNITNVNANGADLQAENMRKENLNCPEGTQEEWFSWGESGMASACKMKHGKFIGWENGHKAYEVEYKFGKPVGEAYWYDKQGNIIKTIKY